MSGADHALVEAVDRADVDAVRAALDAGADPNAQRTEWTLHTPVLFAACRFKRREVVRLLLDRGADPNAYEEFIDQRVSEEVYDRDRGLLGTEDEPRGTCTSGGTSRAGATSWIATRRMTARALLVTHGAGEYCRWCRRSHCGRTCRNCGAPAAAGTTGWSADAPED